MTCVIGHTFSVQRPTRLSSRTMHCIRHAAGNARAHWIGSEQDLYSTSTSRTLHYQHACIPQCTPPSCHFTLFSCCPYPITSRPADETYRNCRKSSNHTGSQMNSSKSSGGAEEEWDDKSCRQVRPRTIQVNKIGNGGRFGRSNDGWIRFDCQYQSNCSKY